MFQLYTDFQENKHTVYVQDLQNVQNLYKWHLGLMYRGPRTYRSPGCLPYTWWLVTFLDAFHQLPTENTYLKVSRQSTPHFWVTTKLKSTQKLPFSDTFYTDYHHGSNSLVAYYNCRSSRTIHIWGFSQIIGHPKANLKDNVKESSFSMEGCWAAKRATHWVDFGQ